MFPKQVGVSILVAALVALLSGCVHQLEVLNLEEYHVPGVAQLPRTGTIGVLEGEIDPSVGRLVEGAAAGLARSGLHVLNPYRTGSDKSADLIARIGIKATYDGSGTNFLINFPGFLVWAPAWNGYVYKADFAVHVELFKGSDLKTVVDTLDFPVNLDIRHAEMDRTWTEVSWLEVGVIALVGGIVFMKYDTDVTPLLMPAIERPIGEYIAHKIMATTEGQWPTQVGAGSDPTKGKVVDASGTGVCINSEGLVLTAYHLIRDATQITVHFSDGTSARAELDKWDANADLATLRTGKKGTPYLTAATPSSIVRGARVFTVGFPAPELLGNDPKYSEGVINSTTGIQGLEGYLQISIPIQPGNSGGAVVTDLGQIAGVVIATAAIPNFVRETGSLPQNVNWATRVEKALALFDRPAELEPASSREAALDRATSATCSIEVRTLRQ